MKQIHNKKLEELLAIAEEVGWNYTIWNEPEGSYGGWHHNERNYVELSKYSPAGEDFSMIIDFDKEDIISSFLKNLKDSKNNFSPEEHAEMWLGSRGKNSIPNSIRVLLNDADAIKQMIFELWDRLSDNLQKANRRKVLITNGMGHERILILTDAPKKSIEQWCRNHNDEMENGEDTYFESLEKDYYVKVLYDSAMDDDGNVEVPNKDIQIIGFDEIYDLFDYYEILGIIV